MQNEARDDQHSKDSQMATEMNLPNDKELESSRSWRLPDISISQQQRAFLENHYSVPTDADIEGMPPEGRKRFIERLEELSPLAAMRLQQEDWQAEDQKLVSKALTGDDQAFLELVGRDPRYLCSDLGLFFISRWQNALDIRETLHSKPTRKIELGFECIRKNIREISSMLLRAFDGRGKNRNPVPHEEVKRMYYAALILFAGIKRISRNRFRSRTERAKWIDRLRLEIASVPPDEVMATATERTGGYRFLLVIQQVDLVVNALVS